MPRFFLALLVATYGHSALADCATTIDMTVDTQKTVQQKMDCLVKENTYLREKAAQAHDSPHIQVGAFGVRDPQELQKVRLDTLSWITSHNGTQVSDIREEAVHGHVGGYNIGLYCFPNTGLCILVAAGPNEQELKDAVYAIHH